MKHIHQAREHGFSPRAHGGAGRRAHGGPGEGRGRRFFDGGELRLVLLLLIEQEPRHGYDLIREIETRSGGAYAPSPGVIYPTLTLLDEMGQVDAEPVATKKRYAITATGRAHLDERRAEAEAALARLEGLRQRSETTEKGPVFRAMNNLKVALRGKLDENSEKETLFSIADVIDEAARKIERL